MEGVWGIGDGGGGDDKGMQVPLPSLLAFKMSPLCYRCTKSSLRYLPCCLEGKQMDLLNSSLLRTWWVWLLI